MVAAPQDGDVAAGSQNGSKASPVFHCSFAATSRLTQEFRNHVFENFLNLLPVQTFRLYKTICSDKKKKKKFKKSLKVVLVFIPPEPSSTETEPQGEHNYVASNIHIFGYFTFTKGNKVLRIKLLLQVCSKVGI